jgi:hypothetical protein
MMENIFIKKVSFLLSIIFIWAGAAMGNVNVVTQSVNAHFTLEKPVIDGLLDDDECWKTSLPAKNFMLEMKQGGKALEKTEVLISYDAESLYLFWKVYESNMADFKPGVPADIKDRIEKNEAVYVYLQPSDKLKGFYLFAASSMGAQLDEYHDFASTQSPGTGYDAVWKAAGGRFVGGWTMEMEIPFKNFGGENILRHSPQQGDTWKVNFCRKRSQGEISQWSLTASSWNNYGCYGPLTFAGLPSGKDIPRLKVNFPALRLGENIADFKFENIDKSGSLRYQISVNGEMQLEKDLLLQDPQLKLPLTVDRPGDWLARVVYTQGQNVFFQGEQRTRINDVVKELKDMQSKVDLWMGKLKYQPAKKSFFTAFLDRIKEKISSVTELLNMPAEKLSAANWQVLEDINQFVSGIVKEHQLELFFLSELTESDRGLNVKVIPADSKVYPTEVFSGTMSEEVNVSMAGNETRSIQLLLLPGKDQTGVKVAASVLTDPGSKAAIASEHILWYDIEAIPSPLLAKNRAEEPDLLVSKQDVLLKAGKLHALWVDINIPGQTPAGSYSGSITLVSDSVVRKIPVTVNVSGFELPEKMSIRHNHWLTADLFPGRKVSPEDLDQALKFLAKYRSATYFFGHTVLFPRIKIYLEDNGEFSFDFSSLTPYFQVARRYHANAYWSSMTCGIALLKYFVNPRQKIIIRKSQKQTTLESIAGMKKWIEQYRQGKTDFDSNMELAIIKATEEQNSKIYFDTNPLYRAFIKDYTAYLKDIGVAQESYFEIYDEAPQLESRWLDMVRHHKFLRSFAPELRLMDFEVNPLLNIAGHNALGLEDGWAPQLYQCADPKLVDAINERRRLHGEEFWFYVCSENSDGPDNYTPYTWPHRPLLGVRVIPWFAWKLQVDGFHLNSFRYQKLIKYYQGRWIATTRLAMLRDGMQDYEYFALLRNLLGRIPGDRYPGFVKRAAAALDIGDDIISDVYNWTRDISILEKRRKLLAELIIEGNKLIEGEE